MLSDYTDVNSTLLDVDQMKHVLSDRVFKGRPVDSCRILHTRRKRDGTLIIGYNLGLIPGAAERTIYLRTQEPQGSARRFEKASALGQTVFHLPGLNAVAWAFPSDRKIPGLRQLLDARHLRDRVLPRIVHAACGGAWEAKSFSSHIVHYVPERSCIVRLDTTVAQRNEPESTKNLSFYGKAYTDEQGQRTFRFMAALWQARDASINVAQPLLEEPETCTIWQLGVAGRALDPRSAKELIAAGAGLTRLHRSSISGLPSHRSSSDRLPFALEIVERMSPENGPEAASLISNLRRQAQRLFPPPPVTLHGDLHMKNFLVSKDRVTLIDLDTLAEGDPIEDVASFAAALCTNALTRSGAALDLETRISAFVNAYENESGQQIPCFDFNWHLAAALTAERVVRSITRKKEQSPAPAALLGLARRALSRAEGQRVSLVTPE